MSEDQTIKGYYETFDEWGRLEREPLEFIVNWHYISRCLPKKGLILDNGAGPGRYALALAEAKYKVALTDLSEKNVTIAKEMAQQQGLMERFLQFDVANATDLSLFSDGQFDASLMLGPMYHIQANPIGEGRFRSYIE